MSAHFLYPQKYPQSDVVGVICADGWGRVPMSGDQWSPDWMGSIGHSNAPSTGETDAKVGGEIGPKAESACVLAWS